MARDKPGADKGEDRGRASLLLANERTFLAHVRTGVAIMAFGFVVAKFALFLRDLSLRGTPRPGGHDALVGAAVTALGAVVVLLGAVRYRHRQRAIERGALVTSTVPDLILSALLAAGGLGLAVFLLVQGQAG